MARKNINNAFQQKMNDNEILDDIADNLMIIQISANHNSMQEIISINRQLLIITEYSEEELNGKKLNQLLPKVINEIHEQRVVKFYTW